MATNGLAQNTLLLRKKVLSVQKKIQAGQQLLTIRLINSRRYLLNRNASINFWKMVLLW